MTTKIPLDSPSIVKTFPQSSTLFKSLSNEIIEHLCQYFDLSTLASFYRCQKFFKTETNYTVIDLFCLTHTEPVIRKILEVAIRKKNAPLAKALLDHKRCQPTESDLRSLCITAILNQSSEIYSHSKFGKYREESLKLSQKDPESLGKTFFFSAFYKDFVLVKGIMHSDAFKKIDNKRLSDFVMTLTDGNHIEIIEGFLNLQKDNPIPKEALIELLIMASSSGSLERFDEVYKNPGIASLKTEDLFSPLVSAKNKEIVETITKCGVFKAGKEDEKKSLLIAAIVQTLQTSQEPIAEAIGEYLELQDLKLEEILTMATATPPDEKLFQIQLKKEL